MSGDFVYTPTTPETDGVRDAAPPVTPPQDATPPVTPSADDEPEVLEIPTGEKLVPLSALESARAKVRAKSEELETLKGEVGKGAEKDARIAELQQQLEQARPLAQAYTAAVEAQRNQPPAPAEPTPQQTAKLQRVAQQLDFYKSDGSLDLTRAQSHLDLIHEEAAEIAQQHVAPIHQQSVEEQSAYNLQRALITKTPGGVQPDPAVVRELWGRVDKRLTATAAGAAQIFAAALGHSVLLGKMPKAQEEIPPPLETERAGGKDVASVTLRESDRKVARDLGITDKEMSEQLAEMPAGWGKGA